MNTPQTTTEYYKQAIDTLRQYIAVETDGENCEQAAGKIKEYRFKIIDDAYDDLVHRTSRLRTLMHDLQAVIDNSSNSISISGAVTGLQGLVAGVSKVVKDT